MQMIIISGLSGAGKSKAGEFLEDAGFYTIDNMPAALMTRFAELCISGGNNSYNRVALVSDIRGGKNFDELFTALDAMKGMGIDCKLLFLRPLPRPLSSAIRRPAAAIPGGGRGLPVPR